MNYPYWYITLIQKVGIQFEMNIYWNDVNVILGSDKLSLHDCSLETIGTKENERMKYMQLLLKIVLGALLSL
jgi:hypothetical protein